MNSYSELWNAACALMREKLYITEAGFNTFLKDSYIFEYKNGVMYISVPTTFHEDIIRNTYQENLKECISTILGSVTDIDYIVNVDETRGIMDTIQLETEPLIKDIGSEYTFENFVIGPSNRYAQAAALSVVENPAKFYNPLLIYGNSGVGKTHLMFAIKNKMAERHPNVKIEYIRCEDFTNMFLESLQAGTISLFHNRFRSVDVLLVDDIQFLENKMQTQEEVFNTFTVLMQNNKQIVITSDRPPKDINNLDVRLRSRFEMGLLADISVPDFETRVGIIRIKSQSVGINLSEDEIYYIADQVKMNTRQLEGIINQMKAYIQLHKTNPSVPVIQSYIRAIMSDNAPDPVNIDRIILEVSRYYKISEADIRSKKRMADIVWARHVAIYLTSKLTSISNIQISKELKMNHTSVGHALKNVEDRIKIDIYEKKKVEELSDTLKKLQ